MSTKKTDMIETATSMIHNIGNVINSVHVATSALKQKIKKSKTLKFHADIYKFLQKHEDDLGVFISNDENGKKFPHYLKLLADTLNDENAELLQVINDIEKNVAHIVEIVLAQKSLTSSPGLLEKTDIPALVEDALNMNRKVEYRDKISIIRQFKTIKSAMIDRVKLLQIMINLIKNSLDALQLNLETEKKIVISIQEKDNQHVMIQVMDTGVGILPENMTKIFSYGFTTKENGHGFGLYSCIKFANQMGGSLVAESEGVGKGAVFTLILPY